MKSYRKLVIELYKHTRNLYIGNHCSIQSSQFGREHVPLFCDHCLKHFGNENFEVLSKPLAHFLENIENWKNFIHGGGWV